MQSSRNAWMGLAALLICVLLPGCGPSPEDQTATAVALTAAAATKLALSAGTIIVGTVSWDNSNATTTALWSDDITEATADHYNGRIIIFTSGALIGQATDITDYVGATTIVVYTAVTEAPSHGDTFVIV